MTAHQLGEADLLAHEFTHSWNGKYRRPGRLYQPDFATAQQGDLLWVYEGMTQYLGNVLAARSGLKSQEQYRDLLAMSAANLDNKPGREWRSTEDTAISSSILRGDGSGVVELAARAGLLPGRRAAVAGCGHADSQADERSEVAERFPAHLSGQGWQYGAADCAV